MPDFGIFRGFNDKLFGDKLYAGQLPTQLGLIGSEDFGTDPDAQAFFDRVTTAGGTLSATEKLAIDALVNQMKTDGVWTKMKAIYPMVGASAAACAQNLKSSSFTGTFSSGWTFASTGVTPNGTSAYMDTNFNQLVNLSVNTNHISIYSRTDFNAATQFIVQDSGITNNATHGFMSLITRGSGNAYFDNGSQSFGVAVANSLGLYIGNQLNINSAKIYKNGIPIATNTNTQTRNPFNNNTYIGAVNLSTTNTAQYFSPRQYAFASIGDGLTDDEAGYLYTAVQAFQTTLSRNV